MKKRLLAAVLAFSVLLSVPTFAYEMKTIDDSVRNAQGQILLENSVVYPYFDSQTEADKAINEYFEGKNKEFFSDEMLVGAREYADNADPEFPYTDTCEYIPQYESDDMISFMEKSEWYMGGVSNGNIFGVTFSKKDGHVVGLAEAMNMTEDEALKLVKEKTFEFMDNNPGMWFDDEIVNSRNLVEEYKYESLFYYIDKDGQVIVSYPTYAISYGAAGDIIVPVKSIKKAGQGNAFEAVLKSLPFKNTDFLKKWFEKTGMK